MFLPSSGVRLNPSVIYIGEANEKKNERIKTLPEDRGVSNMLLVAVEQGDRQKKYRHYF